MVEIKVPGVYIVSRIVDNKKKEQLVTIRFAEYNGFYNYDYGTCSYHEGYCKKEEIRELTPEEKVKYSQNKYFELPHDFYHSVMITD